MIAILVKLALCLLAVLLCLRLTRAHELRRGRWVLIAVSLPFLWSILNALMNPALSVGTGIGAILSCVALAFLWASPLAFHGAKEFSDFIYGGAEHTRGIRPDFRYARVALRDGELEEAIQITKSELEKDPINLEGLVLLVQIYEQADQLAEALPSLEIILRHSMSAEEHRKFAREKKAFF